ncbi:MAG: hypothetical protein ACNS62_22835 [Candidatus Cyclobacteriaceae bacterium M3_2C_046]
MQKLGIFLLSFIFLSVMGCEPEGYYYEDWDADADELIDEDEFGTAYTDVGYYETWDLDNDGILDQEEWEEGIGTYYDAYNYDAFGTFEDWDLDNDGLISDEEFTDGNFTFWDTDGDGFVDVAEYEEWYYDV